MKNSTFQSYISPEYIQKYCTTLPDSKGAKLHMKAFADFLHNSIQSLTIILYTFIDKFQHIFI